MFGVAVIAVSAAVLLFYYTSEEPRENVDHAPAPKGAFFSEGADESAGDLDVLTGPNNRFSIKFYKHVAGLSDENVFFSPLSIFTAFSIVYEGADADTAAQMRQTFDFPTDPSKRQQAFSLMLDNLTQNDSKYDFSLANALWLDEGFEPLAEYVNATTKSYGGKVSTVQFDEDEGVDRINAWIDGRTNGKIKEVLAHGDTGPLTRLAITNVAYFKGTWETQFYEQGTRIGDFFKSSSETVKTPMMISYNPTFPHYENDDLQVLSMPYDGNELSMVIILPKDTDGLESLENEVIDELIREWTGELSPVLFEIVKIPKFTFLTSYDLKRDLESMGMTLPFDPQRADFSKLANSDDTQRNLYISRAVHKTFVEVNEKGTEATAATAAIGGLESLHIIETNKFFIADHPFIFIIQENDTGKILFMGRIVEPT